MPAKINKSIPESALTMNRPRYGSSRLIYRIIVCCIILPISRTSAQRVPLVDTAGIPRPTGIYVMNDASDQRPASSGYADGLTTSPAYLNDI